MTVDRHGMVFARIPPNTTGEQSAIMGLTRLKIHTITATRIFRGRLPVSCWMVRGIA